jgi:poly [ADP-ribose] polymerase 2/3/4
MATLLKEVRLIKTEMGENANKWWNAQLFDDGTVKAQWGRVGYEGDSGEWSGGETYLNKKVKEKTKKGYTEQKTVGAITSGTSSGSTVKNADLHSIAKKQLLKSSGSKTLNNLIDRLVKSNVHKITTSTNITFNDTTGLFQTPLGIVTPDGISEARDLLAEIHPLVKKSQYDEKLNRLVTSYLRIVPRHLGMGKFNAASVFPDESSIQAQSDILDSLEASNQAISSGNKTVTKSDGEEESVFKVDLEDVNSSQDATRLERWYETSKKSMHGYDKVKIRNVFSVKIHEMDSAFIHNDPTITEVFHGTSEANCLSILKSGLKVSPPSTAAIAGKMFGNGIYGAINSSKSLGYTLGRWGQGGVGDSGWLFIAKFAMGRVYTTKAYGCSKPSGYDSVWAKASSGGLYHDELIVYTNNRVTITHLLECK